MVHGDNSSAELWLPLIRRLDVLRERVNATTRMINYGCITPAAASLAGQLLGARMGRAIGCVGPFTTII